MDHRRKFDRRKTDRREQKSKQQSYQKLFLFGVGLAFAIASFVAFFGLFPLSPAVVEASKEPTKAGNRVVAERIKDYDAYREEILSQDEELLASYRQKKERRRENSRYKNSGREYYENRIAQIEEDLQSELLRKTPNKKGSLSWGVRQELKKIKSDPPPQ